jgi:exopolysaccharide biosynthesis polyprenyl glycosylphosphotransferase
MTTLSTYLDALTRQQASSRDAQTHWLVSRRSQLVFLYVSDMLVVTIALGLAIVARGALPFDGAGESPQLVFVVAPLIVAGWVLMLHIFGASELRHLRAGVIEYKRVIHASFATAGSVGIASYLLKSEFPRSIFVLMFAIGTVGLVLARLARRKTMGAIHRKGALLTPIVVAGDSGHVDAIAKVMRRETWLGYKVVGAITRDRVDQTTGGLPVLGGLEDIVAVIKEHQVATVLFAEGSFQTPADFRRMAWQLEEHDVHMIVVPALTDISAQRLDVRPVAGLPLVDVARPQAIAAARWIKRTWDAAGSAVLLLLASPVMALVALAIKLEDGGPVLFRQTRVGLRGETFQCLKFRSMVMDAEARLAELAAANEGSGPLFKMTQDPRITTVGRFIRRFSLDELPQLWNALRGDMSLVGPRPALPTEVAQYDSDTRRRLDVIG